MGDEFISRKTIPSNKLEYSLDEGKTWTPMVKTQENFFKPPEGTKKNVGGALGKAMSKSDEALKAEAKKYKSAEEFEKALRRAR